MKKSLQSRLAETLSELLERFIVVCPDADGNTDPADKKRIKNAAKVLLDCKLGKN